ncbi:MAG: DUF4446 family protein [bacterium]
MEYLAILLSISSLIVSITAIVLLLQQKKILNKFFGDESTKNSIIENIDKYYKDIHTALSEYESTNKTLEKIIKDNKENFSAFSIRRFNPYEDTGGDLSFCFVLLDRRSSGIMMTSLHSRERTRIYTRVIESGISSVELLYDENEALKEALAKV